MKRIFLAVCLLTCLQTQSWSIFNIGMQSSSVCQQQKSWFSCRTTLLVGGAIAGGLIYKYYPRIKESFSRYVKHWFGFEVPEFPVVSKSIFGKETIKNPVARTKKHRRMSLIESLRESLSDFSLTIDNAQKRPERGMQEKDLEFLNAISSYLLEDDQSKIDAFQKKYEDKTDLIEISTAQLLIAQIKENQDFEKFLQQLQSINTSDLDCGTIEGINCKLYTPEQNQLQTIENKKHTTLLTTHILPDPVCAEFSHVYRVNNTNLELTFCSLLDRIETLEKTVILWTENTEVAKYFKELILTDNYCSEHDCDQEQLEQQSMEFAGYCKTLYSLLLKRWNNKIRTKKRSCNNSFRKELEEYAAQLENGEGSSGL